MKYGEGENQWQDICEIFENFGHGWAPEIWNGRLDHGKKFHEAHDLLSQEFNKYFLNKKTDVNRNLNQRIQI